MRAVARKAHIAYSQDNKIKLDEGTLGLVNNEILQTTFSPEPTSLRRWPGSRRCCR